MMPNNQQIATAAKFCGTAAELEALLSDIEATRTALRVNGFYVDTESTSGTERNEHLTLTIQNLYKLAPAELAAIFHLTDSFIVAAEARR